MEILVARVQGRAENKQADEGGASEVPIRARLSPGCRRGEQGQRPFFARSELPFVAPWTLLENFEVILRGFSRPYFPDLIFRYFPLFSVHLVRQNEIFQNFRKEVQSHAYSIQGEQSQRPPVCGQY